MNPPIFANPISQILGLFLKRIKAKELNNPRNLGQRRINPVLFPQVNCEVRNIKLKRKLSLGELQFNPPDLDPIAPSSANIRDFLPGNWFSSLQRYMAERQHKGARMSFGGWGEGRRTAPNPSGRNTTRRSQDRCSTGSISKWKCRP